jgi:hypothetical protein
VSESTIRARADCLHPRDGPSAVQNSERPETKMFLTKTGSDRWTVRSPRADRPPYNLHTPPETVEFLSKNFQMEADRPPPRTGLSAVQFPAKPILGKTLITFNSVNQVRWSWTLWKAYSEDYTTQLNKWSKTKWINPEIYSKIQPIVRSTTKTLFPKHANSKWSPTGWSIPLSLS